MIHLKQKKIIMGVILLTLFSVSVINRVHGPKIATFSENGDMLVSDIHSALTADDIFEDNDFFGQAKAIDVNTTYSNLNVNVTDPDWYKVNLTRGCSYFFDMEKSGYGIDFTIWDDTQRFIVNSSIDLQLHRFVQKNAEFDGTYYMEVYGDPIGPTDYNFTITEYSEFNESWSFLGDKYEYNDGFDYGYPIQVETNYTDGVISSDDVDMFKVNLTEGFNYHVDLDKESYSPYFYLYDSNLELIATSSEIVPYHRNIQINICKNDTYTIAIYGQPDNGINLTYYSLYVYEHDGFNSSYYLGPDRYEYNDDMGHAYPLMVETNYTGMYMLNGSVDWYKVNLTEGYGYHIDMTKNGPGASFYLYDSDGNLVDFSSELVQYHRNIQINICKNDTYYLEFIGETGAADEIAVLGLYIYKNSSGFDPSYNLGPDRYDYNGDMDHAYPLMVETNFTGMYMLNGSVDWYKVNLTEGYGYHIDMTKNGPWANFYLYDSDGNLVDFSSELVQYHRNIQINICKNDTYYLEFIGETGEMDEIAVLGLYIYKNSSGFDPSYNLGPDRYDYNGDMDHAYPLMVETNYTGMYMLNGSVRWYEVNLIAGHAYHFDMVKNGPGAFFQLLASDGNILAHSSELIQYHRNIQINMFETGTYYLRFVGESEENEIAILGLYIYDFNDYNPTYTNQTTGNSSDDTSATDDTGFDISGIPGYPVGIFMAALAIALVGLTLRKRR